MLHAMVSGSAIAQTLVGATPGSFSVTDGGAASYSIPIQVPPGTNGMIPELALAYSSQGSNGLMGVGWGIRGLSAIARCPKTIATDGSYGTLGFTANDQICLDGERLVLKSGTHLSANAEYRAEREIFSKITIKQVSGQPIYFEVRTKAGRILEYGGTADSRLQPSGAPSFESWHLSKVSDRFDNYLTFTYDTDAATGRIRPSRVDYTGNDGAAPNFAPYASVRFVYPTSARSDKSTRYALGFKHDMDKRLDRIETYLQTTKVREYRLAYDYSPVSGASRLTSVTECAGSGACLPATTFAWPLNQVPQWPSTQGSTGVNWDGANVYLSADVRGKGVADIVVVEKAVPNSNLKVVPPDANGGYSSVAGATATGIPWDGDDRWLAGDVNADGFADLILLHKLTSTTREIWTFKSDGNGTFARLPAAGPAPAVIYRDTPTALVGDLDGDGAADLLTIRRVREETQRFDEFHTYLSNGDGSWDTPNDIVTNTTGLPNTDPSESDDHVGIDANGDGLLDVAAIKSQSNGNYKVKTLLSDGTGRVQIMGWHTTTFLDNPHHRFLTNDVNGDGLSDILVMRENSSGMNSIGTVLSKGDGDYVDIPTLSVVGGWNLYDQWIPADLDANGVGDFIRVRKDSSSRARLYGVIGDGQGGFAASGADVNLAAWSDYDRWLAGDATGKGTTDLVRVFKNSSQINTQVVTPLNLQASTGPKVDQITTIIDGIGKKILIEYDSIARTSQGIYTKGSGAVYPKQDLQAAMYVVKKTTESDLNDNQQRIFTHAYGQARMDLWGRGFLGYGTHAVMDQATGIVTTTSYHQDFPREGLIASVVSMLGGVALSTTTNDWQTVSVPNPSRLWVKLASSTVETKDPNNVSLGVTKTIQTFDDYANPVSVTVARMNGANDPNSLWFTDSKIIAYAGPDESNWLIGLVSQVSGWSTAPGLPATATRSTTYSTNASTGALESEISDPGTGFALTTTYQYDAFGNRTVATTSGADISTRSDVLDFGVAGVVGGTADPYFRLPRKHTNPGGHVVVGDYDYALGVKTKEEGPYFDPAPASPIRSTHAYDALGRLTSSVSPDQITTTIGRNSPPLAADNCAGVARYTEKATTTGQPSLTVCYDARGRETSRQTTSFGGGTVRVETEYDTAGRLKRVSQPYSIGSTVYWTTLSYDALNRVTQRSLPDGSTETTSYSGFVTTVTNPLLQSHVETRNVHGDLTRVAEGSNSSIDYTYDAAGRVLTARDASGNTITNQYDARGLKTQMTDPDMGTWTYTYNSLGELFIQTDAKQQVRIFSYDLLGRMRTRYDGTTTQWEYDLAANGVGQIWRVTGGEQSFQKTFEYDGYGRPTKSTTRVGATNYVVQATYDTAGRHERTIYPGGFAIANEYNASGYLSKVKEDGSSLVYWQADLVNAFGGVTKETLGNGLVTQRTFDPDTGRLRTVTTGAGGGAGVQNLAYLWDSLGNLKRRDDIATGRAEILGYDNLNRLTTITGVSAPSKTIAYDALGNITSKTGVGTYTYGSGITVNGAGPHAVKTAGGVNYSYDANGNLTSASNGRTVTYTEYNKPRSISGPVGSSTFYYGGERELVVQVESNGTSSATHTYVGDVYEKSVVGATTEERFYIRSPAGLVAIRTTRTGQPTAVKYVHRDHLGSTDVLTDSTGAVAQRMSFDAFGKRRDAATWSDSALYAYAFEGGLGFSVTPQFTGHTGLGHLELVHMNGRVYDPMIGRFLSADPYVQDPTSPQAFNRYSYVGNNPLSFIDPSGYFAEGPAPPPSGGGDFLSFLSRLFGNQPARHNSRYPAWARRLATKQWQAPIVGVVSSFAPTGPWGAAIIGAGLQAAVNGGSVGEVLLVSAAGVSLTMSNRGNGVWSNRSAGNAIRGGGNWLSKLGENGFGNAATTVFQLQEAVAAAAEGGDVDSEQTSPGESAEARVRAEALRALRHYNPRSVREQREYGGLIYRSGDTISSTPGVRGNRCVDGSFDCGLSLGEALEMLPADAEILADWHTHGAAPAWDPLSFEGFSPLDVAGTNMSGVDPAYVGSFLGTPRGQAFFMRPGAASELDSRAVIRLHQEFIGRIPR